MKTGFTPKTPKPRKQEHSDYLFKIINRDNYLILDKFKLEKPNMDGTGTTGEAPEIVADKKAVRELKIKASILKRNLKDFAFYKKDMDE